MAKISQATLDKLARFDTPTICNVIELFDVRPRNVGFMDARIQACFPEMPPIVGFAATATHRSGGPPRAGDSYASTNEQVSRYGELDGPPIIVFQDLDDPPVAANFGEIMCTAYKVFGAVGLITSGAGRDLEQVRAIKFPVFTSGAICAHGYTHILQVHVPVRVGGIVVYPNDLLHADCNGVTTIPNDIATEAAGVAAEFVAAEAIVLKALNSGTPTVEKLKAAQAEMRVVVDGLRARVSRQR